LDSIRRLVAAGVWVEVTTLVIHGLNDGEPELRALAAFLAGVDPDIPWHVSRFHPAYRMLDRPPTPASTIQRALEIGREEGLRYVYAGNLPGHESESTRCPACGEVVIERRGFQVTRTRLNGGRCAACGEPVAGSLDDLSRDGVV
jgi:pyruvate formate lyase activating enzyme